MRLNPAACNGSMASDASITRGAPLLGEHNHLVYGDILSLSDSEIDDLIACRVIW